MIPGIVASKPPSVSGTPPAVGDYWEGQGGWYIGELTISDTVYYLIDGGYASESSAGIQWKTSQTNTSGTSSASDGRANTTSIVAAGISSHPAAEHCVGWAGGGFGDWYLPSSTELVFVRNTLWQTVGGVPANYGPAGAQRFGQGGDGYWSSTTSAATTAYRVNFSTYAGSNLTKNSANQYVRPIRRVAK